MLTRAKSSTFYVNFAAFCVFIDVFLADIIYVFCNRCNCKLLIISHLDKDSVFQFQLFQLFQLLFSTFQSSFFIYITTY